MEDKYVELAVNKTLELLAIDSPTGYCKKAISYLKDQFEKIGFETKITNKGGLLVDFGGQDDGNGLLFETHVDTLGAMVSEIKSNGRLKITNLGGMPIMLKERMLESLLVMAKYLKVLLSLLMLQFMLMGNITILSAIGIMLKW